MVRKEDRLNLKADNIRKELNRLKQQMEAIQGKQNLINEMVRDLDTEINDINSGELAFYEGRA
jgi:prefoldin subunit 5